MSIDERKRDISDYYNVFKIEINKEYFLAKTDKNRHNRRNSAKLISINQKNAFNFDLEANKNEKNKKTSIMNTSIDQININMRNRELQDKNEDYSINFEQDKKKLSGFFTGSDKIHKSKPDKKLKKSRMNLEKNIYSNKIQDYKCFKESKYKPSNLKPKFSLDVNEYYSPKKVVFKDEKNSLSQENKIPYKHMMKTQFAIYNNEILEETNSKKCSQKIIPGEKTISSKVHPSPNIRSNSVHYDSKLGPEKFITSMVHANANSYNSQNSRENHFNNSFQNVNNPEHLNDLIQNQTPVPIQNKSMFPNRHPRLHQSNNILPNSENIRISKTRPKASLLSNVPQIRFQNYQTIASLKSEMNLRSRKNNYKKKQRQVLKNFRQPQTPFEEGRHAFKSSSSIESGDSDQEMNLEKAYCTLCGEDFG